MQIYRQQKLNLIASTLLILKGSKLNFNVKIFTKKYCNTGFNIGNEIGMWKNRYEDVRLMNWLLVDRYYDNIKYFDLIYTITNKKKIRITSVDFSFLNDLTQ